MSGQSAEHGEGEGPSRPFGLATATFVVVSSMIGTGVLTTSGYTMVAVGSNQLMLAMWVAGGLVALCGALALAELSAALPKSGGDYIFIREAYGPLAGFLSGWTSFLVGFGAPIAASARAAGKYLLEPVGLHPELAGLAEMVVATAVILALTAVHARGRSGTVRVQATSTLVKLAILSTLAAAGLWAGWGRWSHLHDRPPITRATADQMLFSMVYISYAYTGWNAAGFLGGEVRAPRRNLPLAVLLGMGVVVVLYLALNLFYALALTVPDLMAIVDAPGNRQDLDAVAQIAGLSAVRLFGPWVGGVISVAIGLTMIASLSAFILTGPRVVHAMAKAGQFPAFAGHSHPRTGAPHVATWLQAAWVLVVLWSGSLEKILVYASVGLALFSMLTVSAVYVLRWRRPDLDRPFRTPGYPVVPAIFLVATALMTGAAFNRQPGTCVLSVASIAAGLPLAGSRRVSRLAIGGLGSATLALLAVQTGLLRGSGRLASLADPETGVARGLAALAAAAVVGYSLRRSIVARRAAGALSWPFVACGVVWAGLLALLPTSPPGWFLPAMAGAMATWAAVEAATPWPTSIPGPGDRFSGSSSDT